MIFMNFVDIIVIAVILAILGGAVCYIRKAKKRGVTCVGCPNGGNCSGKCETCSGYPTEK